MNVKQISHKNMNKRRDSQLVIVGFLWASTSLYFQKMEIGPNYSNVLSFPCSKDGNKKNPILTFSRVLTEVNILKSMHAYD